jgi:hypothetical protein
LDFGFWNLGERVQRRGADVSTPEIGSRGAVFCFGGISGVYADLRRELDWGNLEFGFFGVFLGVPRRAIEEGGHFSVFLNDWGKF